MTDTTMTLRPERRIARSLWLWLTAERRKSVPPVHLDTLSDYMLRDIGIERDPIDQMAIRTLHDAMRYSS
jgi:uncharacterized protein YjiS (DUF1127 family)